MSEERIRIDVLEPAIPEWYKVWDIYGRPYMAYWLGSFGYDGCGDSPLWTWAEAIPSEVLPVRYRHSKGFDVTWTAWNCGACAHFRRDSCQRTSKQGKSNSPCESYSMGGVGLSVIDRATQEWIDNEFKGVPV